MLFKSKKNNTCLLALTFSTWQCKLQSKKIKHNYHHLQGLNNTREIGAISHNTLTHFTLYTIVKMGKVPEVSMERFPKKTLCCLIYILSKHFLMFFIFLLLLNKIKFISNWCTRSPCLWDKGPLQSRDLTGKVYRGIHTLPPSRFVPVTS
jgi:hypothetical protein